MAGVKERNCDPNAVSYRNLAQWNSSRSQHTSVNSPSRHPNCKDDIKKGGSQFCPPGTCSLEEEKSCETINAGRGVKTNDKLVFGEESGKASLRMWALKDFSDIVPLSRLTHSLPRPRSPFSQKNQTSWSVPQKIMLLPSLEPYHSHP